MNVKLKQGWTTDEEFGKAKLQCLAQGLRKLVKEDVLCLDQADLEDALIKVKLRHSLQDFHIEEMEENDKRSHDITAELIEQIDLNNENTKVPQISIQTNKDLITFSQNKEPTKS